MIDSQNLALKLATAFADNQAKKMLMAQYLPYAENIKNASWIELCDDKISKITVSEKVRSYHKEMYNMLSDFLTEALPPLFEKKYTKENLDKDVFELFLGPIRYTTTEGRSAIIEKELSCLFKHYLIAKNNDDVSGAEILIQNAIRAKRQFSPAQ